MRLPPRFHAGVADGSVTVAFRRQRRATVRAGGTLRTAVGVLAITAVDPIDEADITDADAVRAGYADATEATSWLKPDGTLFRIEFHLQGPDPRIALRNDANLDEAAVEDLRRRLDRFDRSSRRGPWTRQTLAAIRDRPGVRAPDLAADFGLETLPFKVDVRKLKELGLTESLAVGYRLSPRGEAFLDWPEPGSSSRRP